MAINHTLLCVFIEMRAAGLVGSGRSRTMLDLGEQNWFGDVDPAELHGVIDRFHGRESGARLHAELDALLAASERDDWAVARLLYSALVEVEVYRAIDLNGTEIAERHDLNHPVPITEQFDLVTNLGTGEHIFNQAQLFRTVHERTRPGGLMMHWLPNQGCYDHGFYNYHPTFVHDLAAANGYGVCILLLVDAKRFPAVVHPIEEREPYVKLALSGELTNYSMILALLRKPASDAPFGIPQQGYYDNRLPEELRDAWQRLPR
jgi:hypothetical protein